MKKIYALNGAAHPGYGETTARQLMEAGNKVIGFYSKEDEANAYSLAKQFDNESLKLVCIDITNLQDLKEKLQGIECRLDGFVNAEYMFEMEYTDKFDYDLSQKIFTANYHAPMMMAIELKKSMKKHSSIVFITSTESERGSFGGISYAASKAAIHNLIKSLACNWGKKDQIRVNAIAAGWIGGEDDKGGAFDVSMNITPLGRLGKANEIADAVEFLLSDKSNFINANVLFVDGGYLGVDEISKYEFNALRNEI